MRADSTATLTALAQWAKALEQDFRVRAEIAGLRGGLLVSTEEVVTMADDFSRMASGLHMVVDAEWFADNPIDSDQVSTAAIN
jgi:hypothetical protein